MRYVSYTRLVPWEERDTVLTIGEQNAVIENFAKGKDWNVEKRYNDRKKQDDGEGLRQLINDGMARQYDGVVVAAFPYFGPDPATARQTAFEVLYAAGIHFAVAEDGFETAEHSREEVAAYFEQKRRDMHSKALTKWLDGLEVRKLPKWPPYGFIVSEDGLSYVKDEEVAGYLDEIFRRYLAGEKVISISRWLNENGILNRAAYKQKKKGREPEGNSGWNPSKVMDVLVCGMYAGKAERKYGGRIVKIPCEAYISEEEQAKIMARIDEERRVFQRKTSDRENPFIYQIFSEASGESMVLRREEGFIDKAFYGSSKELRIAHSIPFETVTDQAREQLMEEKQRAEIAAQKIKEGKAEDSFQQEKARLSVRMKEALEEMKPLLADGLHSAALASLDAEVTEITDELKRMEMVFSLKNPWVTLFLDTEIPEPLSRAAFQKLAERVTVSADYSSVKVDFKAQDAKRYLPQEWWEGKEMD
ncbi:MAG: recombinase family protein [Lachnospiraceae bacterium]|nr:recombinase family protein [Lachnospiraceae bacterium]